MSCDLGKWPATRTIILEKIALNGSLTAESNARSTWRFNARGPPRFVTRMQLAFGHRVLGLCSLTSFSLVTATGAFPANCTTASAKVANKTGSTRKYVPGSGARSTA